MATLRETIKEITREHLEKRNGLIMGQCLSAVGWVDNTVPDTKGVVELPMTDVAGSDLACGCAVAGRLPILVIRFQDFLTLNGNALVYFAAKRKRIFQKECPVFVRALAKEGDGTGNSHSGKLHSWFMHYPELRCYAPITPEEYKETFNDFLNYKDPLICFEHRSTFDVDTNYKNIIKDADITIFAISLARLEAIKAVKELEEMGIRCNLVHIWKLRPFELDYEALNRSNCGLVVDTSFETCGASRDIAYQYMVNTDKKVHALGLEDKSAGCRKGEENLTPNAEKIINKVLCLV